MKLGPVSLDDAPNRVLVAAARRVQQLVLAPRG
jgi:hypothetical protein